MAFVIERRRGSRARRAAGPVEEIGGDRAARGAEGAPASARPRSTAASAARRRRADSDTDASSST